MRHGVFFLDLIALIIMGMLKNNVKSCPIFIDLNFKSPERARYISTG